MRAPVPVLSVIALLSAAGCAPQPAAGPPAAPPDAAAAAAARQCFSANDVNGFRVVDARTVELNVGVNRVYQVDLLGTCPDVRSAFAVSVRSRTGSSFVCDDLDLDLIVPSEGGASGRPARVCPVTALRRLSEAELAARRQRR